MRRKESGEYSPRHLAILKKVLCDIYSGLGNVSEHLYLVGGLVPDLLVRNKLDYLKEYLGTLDIDLAVKFAVRYISDFKDFYNRLKSLGFERQKTEDGTDLMSHSFIKYEAGYRPIVLDLLTDDRLPPRSDKLKEITKDIEAVKFRGVYLVFDDFLRIAVTGIHNMRIEIKIANIIPFLTLKSFAYADAENRDPKDAFDIWYTAVNFKDGPASVGEELLKYGGNSDVEDAFNNIRASFAGESAPAVKDVVNILTRRYGLEAAMARREVIYPINMLCSYMRKQAG